MACDMPASESVEVLLPDLGRLEDVIDMPAPESEEFLFPGSVLELSEPVFGDSSPKETIEEARARLYRPPEEPASYVSRAKKSNKKLEIKIVANKDKDTKDEEWVLVASKLSGDGYTLKKGNWVVL